jgi:pimeloyl-ACP methyl ester carboxylesterase
MPQLFVVLTPLLLVVGLAASPLSAEDGLISTAGVQVEKDPDARLTRVTIFAENGSVSWSEVLRGLALAGQLDDAALRSILPDGQIELEATGSRLTIAALNLALSPELKLRVLPATDVRPSPALEVTLDERQLEKTRRKIKGRIRQAVVDRHGQVGPDRYGLRLDEKWQDSDPQQPLVLVLHGFNSAPSQIAGLVEAVAKSGLPWGTYSYPNDQPISDSAILFSRDLKRLAAEFPGRRVALVTHSMGGLVARAVIEDPRLDPGIVDQLIQVAPPTHGSQLARLSFGVDFWEYLARTPEASHLSRLYAIVEDGLSEADYDLQPDSDFLRELNARKRNPRVRYSLFLGKAGPCTPDQLQTAREALDRVASDSAAVQAVRPLLREIMDDLDEVLVGQGDGAVAVKRGRLAGVEDTVLLEFTHMGLSGKAPTEGERQLYEAIRRRLTPAG